MEDCKPRKLDVALEKNLVAVEIFGKILWLKWLEPHERTWGMCRDWNKGWFYMLSFGKIEMGCRIRYKPDALH